MPHSNTTLQNLKFGTKMDLSGGMLVMLFVAAANFHSVNTPITRPH